MQLTKLTKLMAALALLLASAAPASAGGAHYKVNLQTYSDTVCDAHDDFNNRMQHLHNNKCKTLETQTGIGSFMYEYAGGKNHKNEGRCVITAYSGPHCTSGSKQFQIEAKDHYDQCMMPPWVPEGQVVRSISVTCNKHVGHPDKEGYFK